MASCRVVNPITQVCGDLLFPGGADKDFYIGYLSELGTRFSTLQTGDISTITFAAYAGLRKMEGSKFAHSFGSETQVGPGGNIAILHNATIKLIAQSTADDVEIQRMIQAVDMYIIYQNNNDQFFILAPAKGLKHMPGVLQNTGTTSDADVSDTLIFQGAEKVKPLRFFNTSLSNTISLLDGYVR